MANKNQTPEEFQGSSFTYLDLTRDKQQLICNPFQPIFENEERELDNNGEPIGEPTPPKIKFVQAFIINYLDQPEDYFFIEGMDEPFDLDINLPDADFPIERIYEVKITLNELNGKIKNAKFQKKPLEGEEGYRDPEKELNLYNANTSFPVDPCVEIFYPICKLLNDNLDTLWFNDNIHWWGDIVAQCSMWGPTIVNVGTPEAPAYELFFGDGFINNIKSKKITTGVPISAVEFELLKYIVLNVDINIDGSINTETLTQELLEEPALGALPLDPVLKDQVPSNIKIILGSISNGLTCSYFKGPIEIEPYVWFTEDKTEEEFKYGTNPYIKYWKLRVKRV